MICKKDSEEKRVNWHKAPGKRIIEKVKAELEEVNYEDLKEYFGDDYFKDGLYPKSMEKFKETNHDYSIYNWDLVGDKENIVHFTEEKGFFKPYEQFKDTQKYLPKIYTEDRNMEIGFVFDSEGNSLGYETLQGMLKQAYHDWFLTLCGYDKEIKMNGDDMIEVFISKKVIVARKKGLYYSDECCDIKSHLTWEDVKKLIDKHG